MGKEISGLASYMQPVAEAVIADANAAGLDVVIEDTDRSVSEQQQKIATGVSWTSHSKHLPQPPEMKSEAIDLVPRICLSLKYWGWNGTIENSHPAWGQLIAIGEGHGLHCGVHFPHPDPGHFQWVHPTV
jgi:hypothetical protein